MSRLSQSLIYIKSKEIHPEDIKYKLTSIIITPELQKLRNNYQRKIREEKRLLLLELESL